MRRSLEMSAVGLLALGSIASADVVEFEVVKSRFYTQVSTVAPNSAHTYQLSAEVGLDAADATLMTVNGVPLVQIDPESWELLSSFPNQAALDAAAPQGITYNLQLQGGALGTRTEPLALPTPETYPPIPVLAPASFLALQAADANQSLFLQWTALTGNATVVGLEILDPLTNNSPVEMQFPLGQTSLLIPAGTLQQDTAYEFVLYFANANIFGGHAAPTGFGVSANGTTAYISELEISFQTAALIPCVDVSNYDLVKARNYEQLTNGVQATTPTGYDFSAAIDTATPGAFGTASMLVSGAMSAQPLAAQGAGEWDFEAEFFGPTAKLDMDAAYPNPGTYVLDGDAGSLGVRSQDIFIGMDAYPPVPVFVGSSYEDLQGIDPAQAVLVQWAPAAGSTDRVFVEIYDVLADNIVFEAEPVLGNSSHMLPNNRLLPGRDYEFHVIFANTFNGNGDNCPGFGIGSEEIAAFLTDTRVSFTTGGAFDQICNGDGGDQMGCTNCPCGNNAAPGTVGGCVNSAGSSARLHAGGDPSVSLPPGVTTDLRFSITGVPAFAFCILNSGDGVAPGSMANPCFGLNTGGPAPAFDGLRCAILNTRRHGGRAADGNGEVGVTNDPWGGEGGPPAGLAVAGGGFPAGQTRYFQVINRDNPALSCMRGLNTTQAVRITFTP